MNYENFFKDQLAGLRAEGRYRVFADWSARPAAFRAPRVTPMREPMT
jgi:hypothetical protein